MIVKILLIYAAIMGAGILLLAVQFVRDCRENKERRDDDG